MNTSFQPGSCLQTIEAMPAGPKQDIAWAEYHYFSGQAEMAVKEVSPYLTHDDLAARLSACLIYAYANLSLGQISQARAALGELNASLAAAGVTKSSLSRCFRLCGVRWDGAASFAAARTISRNPKLFKFAATGASGFFPVCAGALPLFKRGSTASAREWWRPPLPWARFIIPFRLFTCTWWR